MLHHERVECAIAHREPDRPPKGEILIDPDFLGLYEPGYTDRFLTCLHVLDDFDLDLVSEDLLRPAPRQIGTSARGLPIMEDCWGVHYEFAEDGLHYMDFPVVEPGAAESFSFPDAAIYHGENLTRWKRETDRSVFAIIGGTFDNLVPLVGFEALMVWAVEAPGALETLAWKAARFNAELAEIAAEAGADVMIVADDIAYNSGTFVSPTVLRRIFFPPLRWLVAEVHRRTGRPCFLHTDGNINAVLDDIVGCGFDGLHSLQPSAGMDIQAVKKRYGERLCVMGNVDLDYLLPRGTPEEISNHVRALARVLAPGGGWILSTCNTLTRAVPVANARAMYHALTQSDG
ncbi:MAG: uroporphyrinogen decarboxylase family protein [bacterium]|nr:uroporphyrinogen decarboxylase family protein [bacterium]